MATTPGHIHLKPGAVPHAQHIPIPSPHHWRETVKSIIDRNVARGIMKPVDIGTIIEWCHQLIPVEKPDGTIRLTVDYKHLNAQTEREPHYSPSPFQAASQVPPNTFKTVVDVVDGYHSIPLDEESQHLTTFTTEWGRFYYLHAGRDLGISSHDVTTTSLPTSTTK